MSGVRQSIAVRRTTYKRRGAIAVPIVGRVRFGEKRYRREGTVRVQQVQKKVQGYKTGNKGVRFFEGIPKLAIAAVAWEPAH